MTRLKIFFTLSVLILTACSPAGADATAAADGNATATSAYATAFAYLTETSVAASTATPTETPTFTPEPPTSNPTIMPTIEPVTGVASNNVTVRAEPRKGAKNLSGVFFNQSVKVIGRNVGANWFWIIYPNSPRGTAWVLAAAVNLQGDLTHLPIAVPRANADPLVFPPIIYEIAGAPLPLNTPGADAKTALITQLAKVRLGPGIGYTSIGTIDAGATVSITGRINENGWLQIEYPSGLDGRGWISSDLTHMNTEFSGIPFYNLMGTPVSPEEARAGINFDSVDSSTPDPNAPPEPTETPEPTPAGPTGKVYQASEVNIRSGPASSYDLLGSLKLGDDVVVTGLTLNKLWYRIVYPAGPGGYGWVSTSYVRITGGDMTKLTYFDTQGTPLP